MTILSHRVAPKGAFLLIFIENMLKYPHISQKANANRQQAKDIAENRTNRPAPNRLLP